MNKLNLTDRETIEIGIVRHQPLYRIAEMLNKHRSSVSREIKAYRLFIAGSYYAGNDCKYAECCTKRHLCGDTRCPMYCYSCNRDCHKYCEDYVTVKCHNWDKPPYVCNGCSKRRYCSDDKYFYDAKVANKKAHESRVVGSQGVHLSDDELSIINSILAEGLGKGQPLAHILSTHEKELIVSERTLYRYISGDAVKVGPLDLRRACRYKRRRKKRGESGILKQKYRQGRSFQDFESYMASRFDWEVVEMDTVKGKQGYGKVLLTMLMRQNTVMLMFLMDNCKAESVIAVFDYLESGLGIERFKRLFGIILTDNGSEFKRVNELETSIDGVMSRTNIFYCDPMASGQKGRLEKNHEYIRYVIKKGTSLNQFSQEDITLLMNHINSTRRPSMQGLAPYELIYEDDEDMQILSKLVGMQMIPADEVNLTKSLLGL